MIKMSMPTLTPPAISPMVFADVPSDECDSATNMVGLIVGASVGLRSVFIGCATETLKGTEWRASFRFR
jgi:hypothetical protein